MQDPAGAEGFGRAAGWGGSVGGVAKRRPKVLPDEAQGAEAQLFGRRTYEFLAARWPSRSGELADRLNDMPKCVVSSTLKDPDWNNSTVLAGDVMRELSKLKEERDGEIVVAGSIRLVRTLMEHDLVDELRLMIYPVVSVSLCARVMGGAFSLRPPRLAKGPGRPQYISADLVADAVGVLDAYEIAAAHVVGVSAGGAFAQLLALGFPDRVLSLVLISTSPATPGDRSLPSATERFNDFLASAEVEWSDQQSVIEYLVGYERMLAGGVRPFDQAAWRELVRRDVERARDIAASEIHSVIAEGDVPSEPISSIAAPTATPRSAMSRFSRSQGSDPLFRTAGRPLPWDDSGNWSQPTATVFACLSRLGSRLSAASTSRSLSVSCGRRASPLQVGAVVRDVASLAAGEFELCWLVPTARWGATSPRHRQGR